MPARWQFWSLFALGVRIVSCATRNSLADAGLSANTATAPQVNISLPIDHFQASDNRTFNNRYWYNDTYYKPGGPIIIYDYGEAGISAETVVSVLATDDIFSPVIELAKAHSGLALVWEHRYYGASQPCPLDEKYVANVDPKCSYQYLTVDQALEDVVFMANHPNFPGYSGEELEAMAANRTPWLFVGGSYAGARAAWIRVRNPETIFASWASSATVAPLVDGSSYFNTQARALPSNCSADINAALQYIDGQLGVNDTDAMSEMKIRLATTNKAIQFGFDVDPSTLDDANNISNYDLVSGLISAYLGNFQYAGLDYSFCNHLEQFNVNTTADNAEIQMVLQNRGDGLATSTGIVGSGGSARSAANAYMWACVAQKNPVPGSSSQMALERKQTSDSWRDFTIDSAPADSSADFSFGWTVVTETGAFQSWSPEYAKLQAGKAVLSRFADQATLRAGYISSFPGVNPDWIPDVPRIDSVLRYGGWNMTPSHVMFTVGEYDPWRPFTVLSVDQEIGAPLRTASQQIPKCNTAPPASAVFGLVYPDAAHVSDGTATRSSLKPDSPPVKGFDLFNAALQEWLPCF